MKKINIIRIICLLFACILFTFLGLYLYNDYRVKHAIVKVKLIDNLEIEVFSKIKIDDLIDSINGKIIDNKQIDTAKIGKQKIEFEYINEEDIKVPYSFKINIVDKVPPFIGNRDSLTLYQGYNGNIMDNFLCGDNYDDKPSCKIVGEYDTGTVGVYPVTLEAKDSSGNISTHDFKINIIEKTNDNIKHESSYTDYNDILNNYKTENTKIGIDVSKWEGDIDFKKIKEAGVEFAFIRVGRQKVRNGQYIIDENFINNIEGFINNNIKIGVYFFSHADSVKEAKKQARWVLKQIKNYKIDLPVVFDWENWYGYQNYDMSFYNLNRAADSFIEEVEKNGYKGMLYSSKFYLENIWQEKDYDIWLAHYTDKTDYKGKYKIWQICDDGRIDGINSDIDIDIMY